MKYALILMVSWVCCAGALQRVAHRGSFIRESRRFARGLHRAAGGRHPGGRGVRAWIRQTGAQPGARGIIRARWNRGAGVRQAGRGKSGGEYEQNQNVSGKNILLLADDALAAVSALSSHPRLKGISVGLAGISQAGWIAPVAAVNSRQVKFLVMWSGPICKVSEEDIFSKFTNDGDSDEVPTFREALDSRPEKYLWPDFLGRDTDSREDLAKPSIPGLWIFSDNDSSIPVDLAGKPARAEEGRPPLRLRAVLGPGPQQHSPHPVVRHRLDASPPPVATDSLASVDAGEDLLMQRSLLR